MARFRWVLGNLWVRSYARTLSTSVTTRLFPCLLIEFSINTTAWTAGSTLLSLGLSAPQAIGCMVGVALISALVAVLAGWPGSHLYLGFTVLSRASWGMRGGFWPVLNRIVTACVWMGIQAYWGGQCKPNFTRFTT